MPMDIPEAHCRFLHHSHLLTHRTTYSSSSWFLSSLRFLSPYIYHNTPVGNVFRFALCIGSRDSFRRCPVMSMEKDMLTATLKGTCKVVLTIETDLKAGQLLYVTGDPIALGCWDLEMAVLMSPTEHANLWRAEVEIACGVNFKYNYLIKRDASHNGINWRPGPEFSLSVPLLVKQGKNIVVRDSWMRSSTMLPSGHSLMSWIEDSYLLIQPVILERDRDEDETVKHLKSDLEFPSSNHLRIKDELYTENGTVTTSYEGSNSDRSFSERYQPVEEPWLLQSPLLSTVYEDKMGLGVSENYETMKDDMKKLEDPGKLLHQEENNLILKESASTESTSTIILINSSICTMQRIAVLEDRQLVELLLEPVKTNVQCDSVYLGVVTKLVPHMGGAFLNIGSSRPSLMDIKQNREPFIFPPFRQRTTKLEVNGSVIEAIEEHMDAHGNKNTELDNEVMDEITDVVSQEDSESSMHDDDDDEDHETEDELDVSEALADNMNGSIVDHGEAEANFDEDNINGIELNIGEANTNSFHVGINVSGNSQMPNLQDINDSKQKTKKDSRQAATNKNKWAEVQKGTKVIVQVVKEGLGTKGPTLTAYPKLRSRFWVLSTCCDRIGVSKKISGMERTRLKVIAKTLQPRGFGLTVRTVAAGHTLEELQKDLEGLLSTWKNIMEHAKSASLAADEGVEGAVPVILHRAMGQTLSVVQDYFNEKVERMVVDSGRTYHEVCNYLQDIAPDLCDRVELHKKGVPLFDEFNIEEEINSILSKRVLLSKGGSLVIEQTEALVSIDVNGGHVMLGHGNSQEKAILDVNLAAAKQIARELRLRDIGGIIVVDFIDMTDEANKRLVYEEVKKAVERDRSMVKVSELSKHGLMEITRKRVRPSVTFMISEPCNCCHGTGRVEALETSFSKIELEISRLLATKNKKSDPGNPKSWPKFILRVDQHMCEYLTSGRRTRLAHLSSSLKVWILLKVARGFTRGAFEVKPFTEDKENEKKQQGGISALRPTKTKNNHSGKKVTVFPVKKWKGSKK
ncbi:ribonuclease E/G-like protein, chloroplastic isoform X2 [Humulus lupulus]|uniref:ribonuclease E/G-like protein, chloroplastic isoform X2 n=1 Tax=Humulus lupulus TaxID=3486 RepID=UPI002B412155|nr:ribonuclease E/G-like protein, chloroplastic isoform X2 [Humulus lupulus]